MPTIEQADQPAAEALAGAYGHAPLPGGIYASSALPAHPPLPGIAVGHSWPAVAAAYVELTKPRIAILELVVTAAAVYLASWGQFSWSLWWACIIGTGLVAASASSFNMWLERDLDARMPRTSRRPLPAGIISPAAALLFGWVTLLAGLAILAAGTTLLAAALGFLTWLSYVALYTPLKRHSTSNTAIGAVAGALPVLIGWAAVGHTGTLFTAELRLWTLFLVLYIWQFPHFMAIAWLYRRDYTRVGMQMLTVVDPTGHSAGVLALQTAVFFVPLASAPFLSAGAIYLVPAVAIGLAYLWLSYCFFRETTDHNARRLLRGSLVILPAWLLLLLATPLY
ncbi:MAG: heme o synthase [Pirellulales bacterium]|nr:heme o synthase [Pirellulales bacterium]